LSAISIGGEKIRITPAVLTKFLKPFVDKKINLFAISSGEYNVTIFIDEVDVEKATLQLTDIIVKQPYIGISVQRKIGVISVRGPEVLSTPGLLHKFLTPIAREKINILAVVTSYDTVFLFFSHTDLEKAYSLLNVYIPEKISIFKRAKEKAREIVKKIAGK
jgi:aspartokinase